MKVLHFIQGKASKERANGVSQVVAEIAKYLVRAGAQVRVIAASGSMQIEYRFVVRE